MLDDVAVSVLVAMMAATLDTLVIAFEEATRKSPLAGSRLSDLLREDE